MIDNYFKIQALVHEVRLDNDWKFDAWLTDGWSVTFFIDNNGKHM